MGTKILPFTLLFLLTLCQLCCSYVVLRTLFRDKPELKQKVIERCIPMGQRSLRNRVSGYIEHMVSNRSGYLEEQCENCKVNTFSFNINNYTIIDFHGVEYYQILTVVEGDTLRYQVFGEGRVSPETKQSLFGLLHPFTQI